MSLIDDQINYFKSKLEKSDFECNDQIVDKFRLYLIQLLKWNSKMNLISKNDESQVVLRHFFESIALLEVFSIPHNNTIIDVGSGAGFPGLPIKIIRPDLKITLLDSKRYRVLFLKEVVSILNLDGIKVIKERAETLCNIREFKQKFNFVTARAVTQLDKLYLWTHLFLKPGGSILTFKGGQFENEVERVRKLNVEVSEYPLKSSLVQFGRQVSLIQLVGQR